MFSYELHGRAYESFGTSGDINRAFGDIRIGDPVTVFYEGRRPANCSLVNPTALIVSSVGNIIAVSLVLSVLGMCALHQLHLLPECPLFMKCRGAK
jgi:hypothetical protein